MLPAHSVSGFSAGGSLALIHTVALSRSTLFSGAIGASPYGCQTLPDAGNTCSGFASTGHRLNATIPWGAYGARLAAYTAGRAAAGRIPPLRHLRGTPVFLFSGADDVWVYQPVMRAAAAQFAGLNASVGTQFALPAAHAWPVDSRTCPRPGAAQPAACCGWKNASTACAGGVRRGVPRGRRRRFCANTTAALLAERGYAYVPARCRGRAGAAACHIHVHYHPCGGSYHSVGTAYMLQNALPEHAEGTGIIVLYPQAQAARNPVGEGCFDWYGATGDAFDTPQGRQLQFVQALIVGVGELTEG